MACTARLVCLVSTVRGCCKHTLGRASASSRHRTKLEQSTFLRCPWNNPKALLFTVWCIQISKKKRFCIFKWSHVLSTFGCFQITAIKGRHRYLSQESEVLILADHYLILYLQCFSFLVIELLRQKEQP